MNLLFVCLLFILFFFLRMLEVFSAFTFKVELPDLTNKNTGHIIKFEFQINNK